MNAKGANLEKFDKYWTEYMEKNYWEAIDKLFIISRVCKERHGAGEWDVPDEVREPKYDRRGSQFREEMLLELDELVKSIVSKDRNSL